MAKMPKKPHFRKIYLDFLSHRISKVDTFLPKRHTFLLLGCDTSGFRRLQYTNAHSVAFFPRSALPFNSQMHHNAFMYISNKIIQISVLKQKLVLLEICVL